MNKYAVSSKRFLRAAARTLAVSALFAAGSFTTALAADKTYERTEVADTALSLNGVSTFSLNFSKPGVATQTGTISGSGMLTIDGTYNGNKNGTLRLDNINAYNGGITVKGATLEITASGSLGNGAYSGNIALTANAEDGLEALLLFSQNNNQLLGGAISGSGGLTKNGGLGELTISGSNTYTGETRVVNGHLTVSGTLGTNSGGVGAHNYAGNIYVQGWNTNFPNAYALELNQTVAQVLSGNISGNGLILKTGAGKLTLAGNNSTFTGTLSFSNGTVSINNDNNLGRGSNSFDGVLVELTGDTYAKGWVIGENGVTITNAGDVAFNGTFVSAGTTNGSLTKTGIGKLTLSPNKGGFRGDTIVSQGTLSIVSDASIGTGEHKLANGTTLELTGGAYDKNWTVSGASTLSVTATHARFRGNISGTGSLTKTGAGTWEVTPNAAIADSGTISVPVTVREGTLAGNGTFNTVTFNAGTTLSPGGLGTAGATAAIGKLNIGVEGSLTRLNDVTLRINLSGTTVSDLINITGNAEFGIVANTISVPAIGTQTAWATGSYTILQTTGTLTTGNLNNTIFEYAGIELDPANSRFRAALVKVADEQTNGNKLVLNTYATASLQIVWNGTGNATSAAQWVKGDTTTLTEDPAPNNWRESDTGGRWFQNGDIVEIANPEEGAPNVQKTIEITTVGNGVIVGGMTVSGSDFVFNGGKIGGITTSTISPKIVADGKLTILSGASARFNNPLQFINVEVSGEAVFNSVVGTGTTQNPLKINNTGKVTLASGGSFHTNGNLFPEIVNNGTLIFERNENFNYTVTEKISGTGSVEKTGTGVLTLSNTNSYTGATTVRAGKLVFASDANIGTGLNTLDGGALQLAGIRNAEVTYSKSWVLGAAGGTLETYNAVRFGINSVADPETGILTPNPALGPGRISGEGSLTKTGSGILTLEGSNTYTGNTVIREGTLRIWGDWGTALPENAQTPVYDGDVSLAGGSLVLDQVKNQTLTGDITRALVDGVDAEGNPERVLAANASVTKRGENTLLFAGTESTRKFARYTNENGTTQTEGVFEVDDIINGTGTGRTPRDDGSTPPPARFNADTVVSGNITNYVDGVFSAEKITAQNIINDGELRAKKITGNVQNRTTGKFYLPENETFYDIGGTLTNGGTVYFTATGQVLRVTALNVSARDTAYYNITINPASFSDPSQNSNHILVAPNGEVKGVHVFFVENAAEIAGETVAREFSYNLIQGGVIDPTATIRLGTPLNVGIYQLTTGGLGDATIRVTGYSPLGQSIVNTVAAIPFSWFAQLDNINKRQGELRLGLFAKEEVEIFTTASGKKQRRQKNPFAAGDRTEGFWTRGYGSQISTDLGIAGVSDFDEYQYGADVGFDHVFSLNDENKLIVGVFVGFQGARRNFNDGYASHGDTRSIGGGLYTTWINRDGWFAGALVKGQSFRNEFDTIFENNKFNSSALGFAVELGKRFDFGDAWFVEPNLAASYANQPGKTFRTNNGTVVTADDGGIFRATASLRFGKAVNLEDLGVLVPYARIGVENQSSSRGKISVADDATFSPDVDGTRILAGIGAAWQFDNANQVYFDFETADGDKYKRPWAINVGYRLRF
ncbi:MAG: autotransporter outer membrane beta-barrel domain-containing protein [Puniceicoccales bacterium]|nr:autotransporter outer membrane beta-barrel domain-containing protein [Puniceicoccales bacterium]